MANTNLHKAKIAKNDEFYTQLSDIENELRHYKAHFKGKIVFCNCDDPTWSAFWKYFHLNFEALGLKKLISTHYDAKERTYKLEYEGGNDTDISVGTKTDLLQNGDFRSEECIEILKESDVVVSNPPFSLWRLYIEQLMEYDKKFVIIGNKNAVTNKDFFPLLKENKVWIGYNSPSDFMTPEGETKKLNGLTRWFTNLDIKKRHEDLILWKHYTPEEYPKYSNYSAINVNKVSEIPCDYDGIMGVPITFLDNYNPDQFEIIWQASGNTKACCPQNILENIIHYKHHSEDRGGCGVINDKRVYSRILIRKKVQKMTLSNFMHCPGEKVRLFEKILDESNLLYQQKLYTSLLMIVLTFPDICGSIEYPEEKSTKKRYKNWLMKHVGEHEGQDNPADYVDMIYELRCSLLHSGEGYNSLHYEENNRQKSPVNEFNLIIPNEKYGLPCCEEKTSHHCHGRTKEIVCHNKVHNLDIKDFTWKLINMANNFYKENKLKFGSMVIINNDKNT